MRFDADRLASLAGLRSPEGSTLNEASNRTQHDEKYYQDEVSWRVGKNQLSEQDDDKSDTLPPKKRRGPKGDVEEAGMAGTSDSLPMDEDEHEVVLEIDETMLKNEIKRMRSQRIHENKLRLAIRNEIQDIFGELGYKQSQSWVYGDNKPQNSRDGSIVTAFPGIGFM